MRKVFRLYVLIGCLLAVNIYAPLSAQASLTNVYIAQTAQGANTGADCADAVAVTFFNNGNNWGTGSTQIGPGTTVHLCGTFTGSAGGNLLIFRGSGATGNPVTLKFEANAVLQAPYWGNDPFSFSNIGAVACNGFSWIVVDGGTNGIIQNTANGTGLANQHASVGIDFNNCSHYEIKNVTVQHMYTHTQDDSGGGGVIDIWVQGGDFHSIHDNVLTDAYQNLNFGYSGANSFTSASIYNNTIDHGCHFIQVGDSNSSSTGSGLNVYNNTLGPHQTEWTISGGGCHSDGIIMSAFNSGSVLSSVNIYNNIIWSDMCNATTPDSNFNCTGWVFLTGGFNQVNIVNNVMAATIPIYSGYESLLRIAPNSYAGAQQTNFNIYNNTFIGNNSNQACDCAGIKMDGPESGFVLKNNIFAHATPFLQQNSNTTLRAIFGTTINNNDYYDVGAIGADRTNSQVYYWPSSLVWTQAHSTNSFPGYDVNGSNGDPKFDANYKLQSGSAAIGLGANLTSLCTGSLVALCTDRAGVARPSTGPWDAGAYQYLSSGSSPAPPTGLGATIQ